MSRREIRNFNISNNEQAQIRGQNNTSSHRRNVSFDYDIPSGDNRAAPLPLSPILRSHRYRSAWMRPTTDTTSTVETNETPRRNNSLPLDVTQDHIIDIDPPSRARSMSMHIDAQDFTSQVPDFTSQIRKYYKDAVNKLYTETEAIFRRADSIHKQLWPDNIEDNNQGVFSSVLPEQRSNPIHHGVEEVTFLEAFVNYGRHLQHLKQVYSEETIDLKKLKNAMLDLAQTSRDLHNVSNKAIGESAQNMA